MTPHTLHPERWPSKRLNRMASFGEMVLILALVAVAVPVFASVLGVAHIPALEATR